MVRSPGREEDPRDYAVAAKAQVYNPPGQWNLHVQVVVPSITTSDAMSRATVISDGGRRVMHTYLVADPASSSLLEMSLWTTLPTAVEWRGVPPDDEVMDPMAVPLCSAYLGSCR